MGERKRNPTSKYGRYLFDVTVVAVAGAFQAVCLAVVDVNLVIHRRDGKALAIGRKFNVWNPMSGVAEKEERMKNI